MTPSSVESMPAAEAADTSAILEALEKRAPFAREIVTAFCRLAVKRAECKAALAQEGPLDITFDPEQFAQGTPLFAGMKSIGSRAAHHRSAACLLPEMELLFPPIAPALAGLRAAFADAPRKLDLLLDALIAEDAAGLEVLAADLGTPLETLVFAGREIVKPWLEKQAETLAPLLADMPWSRGYCPVCGSQPDLAYLRPKDPEPSEYLVSKSGQLWMHCSLCAHQWRFLRSKCPHCGDSEPDNLMYFADPGNEAERVYACNKCKHYYPCVDITDRKPFPDLDLEPLALIHLDYLAQKKGYIPLARLPWNQFPLG